MKKYILSLSAVAMMLVSCGSDGFKVSGTVDGGEDTTKMVLETSTNGRWFLVDSVKTKGNGKFEIEQPAPKFAEIYRLRHGDQSIYFPIDSLESLNIKTSIKAFNSEYTIEGSDKAVTVMNVDKKAISMSALPANEYTTKVEAWKRELAQQILNDPGSIVAYYIINKYIGDQPLFDPVNDFDLKIVGAVANAYNSFKPNDPRTAYLVNVLRAGQQRRRQSTMRADTVYVNETPIIDIKLQDNKGVEQDLLKVSQQGKVVLLNFTLYTAEFSPVFNKALADVYRRHSAAGLEIYQIAFDNDEFQWRQSAANLPWITVYDPMGNQSKNLVAYNVTEVPLTYVISRKGEIVERISDVTKLEATVSKYM